MMYDDPLASTWGEPVEPQKREQAEPVKPKLEHPQPQVGPYGRQPQVYGAPADGLVSPRTATASNGQSFENSEPYLRVRITGLDRNRRDVLARFDAQTNLPNFTGTTYRNVSRSFAEIALFQDQLVFRNPHTIVPALPPPQTSAPTDEEDDRLVKIMLQRWIDRICANTFLLQDEELRLFVESDFGYQPTILPRRKGGGGGFGLLRRGAPDEDLELQQSRFELAKLETQFFDAAKAIDKVGRARRSLAAAHAEMGNKLVSVATTEAHPPLGNALRKMGRAWHIMADNDGGQSASETVILGDALGYQGLSARTAKETLMNRAAVLEDHQAAVKSTISKRRQIERLKASSNIRPERVDEALEDLEEATKYEEVLAKRVDGISQNLHRALQTHAKNVDSDLSTALIEHVRVSLAYERQLLREMESIRGDVRNANAARAQAPPPPPQPIVRTLMDPSQTRPEPSLPAPLAASPGRADPLQRALTVPSVPTSPLVPSPLSPPSQTPIPATASNGPPLGGRFVDGTQSMFIPPATKTSIPPNSPLGPAPVSSQDVDPLSRSTSWAPPQPQSPNPVNPDLSPRQPGAPGAFMSQSMRVTPTYQRPRLDAREAASKLANFL